MAKIQIIQSNLFSKESDAIAVPVPARVRRKKDAPNYLPVTKEILKRYKISAERIKDITSSKEPYSNGEVYIIKDVDITKLDIENQNVQISDLIETIEQTSKLIVVLPIKTRDDKEINEQVYLASLRALSKLIKNNAEFAEQFKIFYLPVFPGLLEHVQRLEDMFDGTDVEIAICLDTSEGVIM